MDTHEAIERAVERTTAASGVPQRVSCDNTLSRIALLMSEGVRDEQDGHLQTAELGRQ
jgi:hypothetical protein